MNIFSARSNFVGKLHQHRVAIMNGALVVLTLSVFGPYLVGSLRTDQLVAYLLFLVVVPINVRRLQLRGTLPYLIVWGVYLVVALVGIWLPFGSDGPWERGSEIAGLDNLLLPLAVMLLIWTLVPRWRALEALMLVGRVLTVLMAVNAVLALISTRVPLSSVLRVFWSGPGSEPTTAELAAANGRFSGIFNHPAEAGLLYGVAGLLAVLVWRNRQLVFALVVSLILIGGMITVSKVFIIGGLPLIAIYWFVSLPAGRRFKLQALAALAALCGVGYFLVKDWSGFDYLSKLFDPTQSQGTGSSGSASPLETIIDLYSAGRFTSGSTINQIISHVLTTNPISGVGAGGWVVPYDNGWVEALIVAGLIGVVAYTTILVLFFRSALRFADSRVKLLGIFLTVYIVGASLGIPALTGNRVSLGVWLVMSLYVLAAPLRVANVDGKPDRFPRSLFRRSRDTEEVTTP